MDLTQAQTHLSEVVRRAGAQHERQLAAVASAKDTGDRVTTLCDHSSAALEQVRSRCRCCTPRPRSCRARPACAAARPARRPVVIHGGARLQRIAPAGVRPGTALLSARCYAEGAASVLREIARACSA